MSTKQCAACREFFSRFQCAAETHGECDCPQCQGYCACQEVEPDPEEDLKARRRRVRAALKTLADLKVVTK